MRPIRIGLPKCCQLSLECTRVTSRDIRQMLPSPIPWWRKILGAMMQLGEEYQPCHMVLDRDQPSSIHYICTETHVLQTGVDLGSGLSSGKLRRRRGKGGKKKRTRNSALCVRIH